MRGTVTCKLTVADSYRLTAYMSATKLITKYYSNETLTQCFLMLDQRLRRWPKVEPTLAECTMFKKNNKVTQLRARAIKELRALVESLTHICHSSI